MLPAQLQAGIYPEPLGSSFAEMAGKDFTSLLAQYTGPGLILNGERDKAFRRGEGKFAAQPAAYNEAVRAFARSIGWV